MLVYSGVEVVKGGLDDEASLKSAIEGAYGVFLNTIGNPQNYDPKEEIEQVRGQSPSRKTE